MAATPTGNRLDREVSLYLRQHKDNPVDWYPWGEAAFAQARLENKPVLLSIGYAACHWCHVMARESFEDPETAVLMNERFINIKVDREERPDIDAVYMRALTSMGQRGGWPLTMFLTPDGKPFWGGTYFPPRASRGLPAFRHLLLEISDLYRSERDAVERNISAVSSALKRSSNLKADEAMDVSSASRVAEILLQRVDSKTGGLKGAPKFPHVPIFRFLWNTWLRTGRKEFEDAVLLTLTAMSQGGLYDHLGGGFARYAVDENWIVPHFEKMLYDNALLIELLTAAWSATREKLFAERVHESIGWVLREVTSPSGAFAASLAAESEGEEGRFYLWTLSEIRSCLGSDAQLFADIYGVSGTGQFGDRCVLHRTPANVFQDETTEHRLAECRRRLFAARAQRPTPIRDDKIVAGWNGLMIAALARAGIVFDQPTWLSAAAAAFEALARSSKTTFSHAWFEGKPCGPAILDDYACLARAAIILFEATGDQAYLEKACGWVGTVLRKFAAENGGFYLTQDTTSDVFMRLRNAEDDATPSGNAVLLEVLVRLHAITGDHRYAAAADRSVRAFSVQRAEDLAPMAAFVDASQFHRDPVQVVIVGRASAHDATKLRTNVFARGHPDIVVSTVPPGCDYPLDHPAYAKTQLNHRATAYICAGQVCSAPITDPRALSAALPGPISEG